MDTTFSSCPSDPEGTWSLDRLRPHSGSHAQGVFAPVHGDAQTTHDLTHGGAGVPQTRPLPRQLGRPHPVPTALHILKHTYGENPNVT